MGFEITQEHFDAGDHARFARRLGACLEALSRLLQRPGFGAGPTTLGAELEMSLIDGAAHALPLNRTVLKEAVDPRFTVELDRFNLECNLDYAPLAGAPLQHLERQLRDGLAVIRAAAARHGGRVVPIGILPTLRSSDLRAELMTDSARFRVLASALRRARGRPFEFRIDGADPLHELRDDVTFEGAATSLQVHLRVEPSRFGDTYNAAQLASAPALAVACNSPIFLGHRLWHETRIALFKQAVDDRTRQAQRHHAEPRVDFGTHWLRGGALELFEQIRHHEVLLPACGSESEQAMRTASAPQLRELRVHQGTIWSWNRPVYDPADGGHLRLELRSLPAGPSVPDMVANVAFSIGLIHALRDSMGDVTAVMPFADAEHNFYRAAQHGLEARLVWPDPVDGALRSWSAAELVPELVPLARRGLHQAGVAAQDAAPWLDIIEARARSGQTGSAWQLTALAAQEARGLSRPQALQSMLENYLQHCESGVPVHRWPLP